jgi:hypothetical protein
MGDKFIPGTTYTREDERNSDEGALLAALRLVGARARELAGDAPIVAFVCADTLAARALARAALAPLDVVESPAEPVHIGFPTTFAAGALLNETRSVAREHLTLATAAAIFIASSSGFSRTACAIAGVASPPARCFQREGADWVPVEPGRGVYL